MSGPDMMAPMRRVFMQSPVGRPGLGIICWNRGRPTPAIAAWILAHYPSIVPIPGTTKLHRLQENTAAADLELSPADLAEITAAADQLDLTGGR
jgi:diketogulonate reductase-like aldo/keto reductase